MPANWSVMLNVIFLVGVLGAIVYILIGKRKQSPVPQEVIPESKSSVPDDIIAVRKISETQEDVSPDEAAQDDDVNPSTEDEVLDDNAKTVMLFLLAKDNSQLAGYELLQTLLAAGLRFGEGHLFHRHQDTNGKGPVLFSLAAATPSGVFDMQNIGALSVRGLCLYMQISTNETIDAERLEMMVSTAKQLSDELDTHLLDDRRQPLSDESIRRYHNLLKLGAVAEEV